MDDLAKLLVVFGLGIALTGGVLFLVARVGGIPRLPGDFVFQSGGLTCLVPIATSIILSIVLTILLNIILRVIK
jgi:hypothetical protein